MHEGAWDETNFEKNLNGTAEQTAKYISSRLQRRNGALEDGSDSNSSGIALNDLVEEIGQISDLKIHNGAPKGINKDFLIASFAGLFLQWGTTGSAMVIAYK